MSSDVIIGNDGKPRCAWVGAGATAIGRYHDKVWGTRTHVESALFEALTLGNLATGGALQQIHHPLSGVNLIRL